MSFVDNIIEKRKVRKIAKEKWGVPGTVVLQVVYVPYTKKSKTTGKKYTNYRRMARRLV